ncbi:hypothetical protein HDE_06261 [Halotydeus destructor]|nr:hypothetical protein HDE_06261 [Halotydeus destructor]
MYDSARTKEWLVRNGYGTVTSASVKKNNNHWSKNIFSPWKKKPSSAEKSGLVHADQQQQLQQHLNGHHHAESLYALQMRVPNGGHHHHYNVVVPSPGPGGVGGRFCSLSAATANVYLSRPAEHLTYSVVPVTASDHHHHHHTHHQNNRQQSVSYHSATVRSPTRTSARQRTSLFASQWEPIHQSQFDHERIISHPDQREREDVHDLEQLNQLRYDKKVTKCTCDTARSTRSNYSQSARTRAMNATFSASSKPPFCAYHHNNQKEQLPPARHPVAVSNVRGSSTISGSQTRTLPDGNQFSRYFDLRNGFDPAASPSDGQPKRPERRVTGGATVNEKLLRSLNGSRDTFSSLASRKSFFALANELSAYDLIQKRYQSDLDDDLSDNVLEKPEICEDAALVEVEEEEETRNCEKSHADASAVKSGTGPRKAKPRAAMFHSVSRARHKKSVSVSNNTSSPSVGGPANDLLTSNRRIGGQGMFLFSRDKSQQMESSGLSGGSSSSNTTSGGLGSVKSKAPPKTRFDDLNSVNQVAACDEVTSKGAPPTESHFTVPEPDYDLSDEDVAPESGPLVACHHSSVVMADKASPLTSGSNNNNNNIPRPPPLPPTGPPSVQPLCQSPARRPVGQQQLFVPKLQHEEQHGPKSER